MKKIKVGDSVRWRGAFGMNAPRVVRVESMELTDQPRSKYGDFVDEATEEEVKANRVVFSLSSGNWAYSDQIELID